MQQKYTGFSLVELLVVIAILGLIAGLVGPQVMKHFQESKVDAARLQIEDFGAALDLFYLEIGRYPNTQEGLMALVKKPSTMEKWSGPYLKKNALPADPWGVEYQYKAPGDHGPFDLYSYGADNKPGGENINADVVNWE